MPAPGSPVVGPPAAWNLSGDPNDFDAYFLSSAQVTTLQTTNWTLTGIMQNPMPLWIFC
jgi:hypothetical protein